MKRTRCPPFIWTVIERAIQPHDLTYRKWLDFNTSAIDWCHWETRYDDTVARRKGRGAEMPEGNSERLVALAETFAFHLAMTESYVGNVELQLVTHSMISYRFTSKISCEDCSWGYVFREALEEVCGNVRTFNRVRFCKILDEVKDRVVKMRSPIVDGKYLCYPIGTIIGIDGTVDY